MGQLSDKELKEQYIAEMKARQIAEIEEILFPSTKKEYIKKEKIDKVEKLKEILLNNMLEALTDTDPARRDNATRNFSRYVFAEKKIDVDEIIGDTVINVVFDSLKPAVNPTPTVTTEPKKETDNA